MKSTMTKIFGADRLNPTIRVEEKSTIKGKAFRHLIEFLLFTAGANVLLWPLALNPNGIAFHPRGEYTDLLVSHWPNAAYLRDSLSRHGQLPLWNTQIMAGQPFDGDPLAGLWYPPNLLLLILPLPIAFNLLFLLHVAWAGYGIYRFLRSEGMSPGPAIFGGLIFAGTPKLMAHLGAGHVSLIFALAWTPWLLMAIKNAARGGLKESAIASACMGLVILVDLRWALFAGMLGLVYWITQVGRDLFKRDQIRRQIFKLTVFGSLAVMLSAVLTLPLYRFLLHSVRSGLTFEQSGAYAMPPAYLIGMLIPDPYGYHEWMTYLGIVPLLLAISAVAFRHNIKVKCNKWLWAGVMFTAAGFSLGNNFFVFPLLFQILPGSSLFRVPPRAWFLVAFGVSVLAALSLQSLVEHLNGRVKKSGRYQKYLIHILVVSVILITAGDLIRVNRSLLETRQMEPMTPATDWISNQPGLFRVYSPSYSLPFPDELQHVDGIDPLHLRSLSEFMARASGLSVDTYSVTVPSYVDKNAEVLAASPEAESLGLLNVKYVAAEFPLRSAGFRQVKVFGQTYIYENEHVRPRAWMEGGGSAQIRQWSPNRIEILAKGEGRLVLSEVAYPGWVCWVDGARTPVTSAHDLLRSVQIGPGEHTVVFAYHPWPFYLGAATSILGLIGLVVLWRWAQ